MSFEDQFPEELVSQEEQAAAPDIKDELQRCVDLLGGSTCLKFGRGPFGRGLFATKDMLPEETALSLPLHACIVVRADSEDGHLETPPESAVWALQSEWQRKHNTLPPILSEFVNACGVVSEQWRLAMYFLWAIRRGGDAWESLGSLFPAAADCPVPLLWAATLLDELQDTALSAAAVEEREQTLTSFTSFMEQWDQGAALLEELGNPTPSDFLWALCMVKSRAMKDTYEGEALAMIVPLADMANHSLLPGLSGEVNEEQGVFELICMSPNKGLQAGVEGLVCYQDDKTNFQLMQQYGFITQANPYEIVVVNDAEGDYGVGIHRARFERCFFENAKQDQVAYIPSILKSLSFLHPDDPEAANGPLQQCRAMHLVDCLGEMLAGFDTTADDDAALLEKISSEDTCQEAALRYRLERKRLLGTMREVLQAYANSIVY